MLKKYLLLTIAIIITSLSASARDFKYTYGGKTLLFSVTDDANKEVSVIRTTEYSYSGKLLLPEHPQDNGITYTLTRIDQDAFYNCKHIESVVIPNTVRSIGVGAFAECYSLTSITIPSSVESIEGIAFYKCTKLKSVNIEDGANVLTMQNYYPGFGGIFTSCPIETLYLGRDISSSPFIDHRELKKITFGDKVTSIGDHTFSGCWELSNIQFSESLTSIGGYAFFDCYKIPYITIPDGVKTIGVGAFSACSSLGRIDIGSSVNYIGDRAFANCGKISIININDSQSVLDFGKDVFYGSSLESLYLGRNFSYGLTSPFAFNSGLYKSITFGAKVSEIPQDAFENCKSYDSSSRVVFPSLEAFWNINFGNQYSNPLYFIGHLYVNESEVTSIDIPGTFTSIKPYQFYGWSGLKSIDIPATVNSIGMSAFAGCSGLSNINIPNAVTTISESLFEGCSGLKNINISSYVTTIENNAFKGCSNVISIMLPSTLKTIGNGVFEGCYRLTTIDLPLSVTYIGIGAFRECKGLTSFDIPENITSLGVGVFEDCVGLTSVSLPTTLKEIPEFILSGCTGLTSILIPKSVTQIGRWAFSGCTNLNSIYSENPTPPECFKGAFLNCPSDAEVYVPTGKILWYKVANEWNNFKNYKEFNFPIVAKGIEISPKGPFELKIGESMQLSAVVLPEEATDKTITWESQSQAVGVDNNGLVTAKSVVENNWIMATNSAGQTDTVYVNVVSVPVTSIEINKSEITLKVGETYYVDVIINPSDASDKSINWASNDPRVASVNRAGRITGESIGETTITVKAQDGSDISANITVKVVAPDPVYGNSFFIDDFKYTTIADGEVAIAAANTSIAGEIIIPDSVTYKGSTYAVTAIGESGFRACKNINTVEIPNTVSSIKDLAFAQCSGLSSIAIPRSVTSIGMSAFHGCSSLTALDLPSSITSIGNSAFSNCSGLVNLDIPNSVTHIGTYAFGWCSNLQSVHLPEAINLINENAFHSCISLSSIHIPNSVTNIGMWAFSDCTGLNYLSLGNSLQKIDMFAFSGCMNIKSITNENPTPPVCLVDAFCNVPADTEIYVPIGASYAYQVAEGWNYFSNYKDPALNISISILPQEPMVLKVNDAVQLTAKISPEEYSDLKLEWMSSAPEFICVDDTGRINAVAIGEADIKVKAVDLPDFPNLTTACKISVIPTLVESIQIEYSGSTEIKVGDIVELYASILPEDVTVKQVIWESSNPAVATVAQNGIVTGVSLGKTDVIAKASDDSGVSSSLTLTVVPTPVESVELIVDGPSKLMDGQCVSLSVKILPSNATDQTLVWQSDNEGVATVENGLVTAHSQLGIAHISATTSNGLKTEVGIEVVETPVRSITINSLEGINYLYPGEQAVMTATILPATATNKDLIWYVEKESVISVDDKGVVTALSPGNSYVCAMSANEVYGFYLMTVRKSPVQVERIELESKYSVPLYTDDIGQVIISTLKIEPKIYPENATVKELKWSSSNENVVSPHAIEKNTFYAYCPGKAILTCEATDGSNVTTTCEVEVVPFGDEDIRFSVDNQEVEQESSITLNVGETINVDVIFYLKPFNKHYDDPTVIYSPDIIEIVESGSQPLEDAFSGYKRQYAITGLTEGVSAFHLYADNTGRRIWIEVSGFSDIDNLYYDASTENATYYNLHGYKVSSKNLRAGFYIKKTGNKIEKVYIGNRPEQ